MLAVMAVSGCSNELCASPTLGSLHSLLDEARPMTVVFAGPSGAVEMETGWRRGLLVESSSSFPV